MNVNTQSGFKTAEINGAVDDDGFRKASFSVRNPVIRFCVAAKVLGDQVLVRDTKDPGKATLTFSKGEWEAFVAGAKAGEFDI